MLQFIDVGENNDIVNQFSSTTGYKKNKLNLISKVDKDLILWSQIFNRIYKMDKKTFVDFENGVDNDLFRKSLLLVPDGMENWLIKKKDILPLNKIVLFVSNTCNLKCTYCYTFGGERSGKMDFEFAKKMIDGRVKINKKDLLLHFQGSGEPTLAINVIKEIVKYAREKIDNPTFSIQTNGVVSDSTLNWLIANDFTFIVSCDGPPEIQLKQRPAKYGPDYTPILEKTIRRIVENKKKIFIRSTISDYSSGRMIEIIEYFHNLGINNINVQPVSHQGRAAENPSIYTKMEDNKKFVINLLKAVELAEEYNIDLNTMYLPVHELKKRVCTMSPRYLTAEGYVTRCISFSNINYTPAKFINGRFDLKKKEFVHNKNEGQFFDNISVENMPDCENCFLKLNCGGMCPLYNYNDTGDIFQHSKSRCDDIRYVSSEYMIYKVMKELKKKPYFLKKRKKLKLAFHFNEFEIMETDGDNIKGNPLLRIDLDKSDLTEIADKLIKNKKLRLNKPTINVISFKFEEKHLWDKKIGEKIINFLKRLNEEKVWFKIIEPFPICSFPENYELNHPIPKSWYESLDFFFVEGNGTVTFLNGYKGKKSIDEYSDRNEMINEFKQNSEIKLFNKCENCIKRIRNTCQGMIQN